MFGLHQLLRETSGCLNVPLSSAAHRLSVRLVLSDCLLFLNRYEIYLKNKSLYSLFVLSTHCRKQRCLIWANKAAAHTSKEPIRRADERTDRDIDLVCELHVETPREQDVVWGRPQFLELASFSTFLTFPETGTVEDSRNFRNGPGLGGGGGGGGGGGVETGREIRVSVVEWCYQRTFILGLQEERNWKIHCLILYFFFFYVSAGASCVFLHHVCSLAQSSLSNTFSDTTSSLAFEGKTKLMNRNSKRAMTCLQDDAVLETLQSCSSQLSDQQEDLTCRQLLAWAVSHQI